jgi:DNA-binding Xre family transcriptional regulator
MSEAKIVVTGKDATADAFASVEARFGRLIVAAEKVKHGLEAIGVAYGLEKATEYVGTALEQAAALEELSQRTGIATESLSQLQYAAKLSSVSTDTLTGAMKKLQVSMANALAGDKLKIALFEQLNVTQKDLGAGTQAVMMRMADAYAHAQDGAGKTAVSIGLMGKAGDEMVPFLNKGSAAIRDMMGEADALGLTISRDFAEAANEFETNLTRIHASSQSLAIVIAGNLVHSLNLAEEAFIRNAKEGNKFVGVLQAWQQFITGDDLHKANVQLTQDTEKLLKAQDDLDRLKRQGYSDDSMAVQQKRADIAQLQSGINTTINYRHALEGESDAKKATADAARNAREQGAALEAQSKLSLQAAQAEAAEYRGIVKAIDERVEAQKAELSAGRPLTDFEKFALKIAIDMRDAKVALTAAHKASIAVTLQEAEATDLKNQGMKSELELAKQIATQRQSDKNTDYTQSVAGIQAIKDAWDAQLKTVKDSVQAQQDEAAAEQLVVQLNVSHAEAVQMLTIARLRDDQTRTNVDGEAYKALQDQIDAHRELLGLLSDQTAWRNQQEQIERVADLGHQLWDDLGTGGHDVLKRLGDDIRKYLIEELYQLVAKQWVFSIGANITGGVAQGVGGGIGTSLLGTAGVAGLGSFQSGGAGLFGSIASTFGIGSSSAAVGSAAPAVFNAAMDSQAANVALGLSGEAGILGAMGPIGWAGLAALAAYSIFGGKGGGPKTESGYGTGVPLRGDASGATTMAQAFQADYAARAQAIGVDPTLSNVGLFYAQDPQGTAMTQLQLTAGSYDRAALTGGGPLGENVGRGQNDLTTAVSLAEAQAELKNFQEKATGEIGTFLKTVDITTASLGDMQKALDIATDVGTLDHALAALGGTFSDLKDVSVQGKESLAQEFGGVQNLVAGLANFNDKMLTDAEKQQLEQQQLTSAFTQAGVALPASLDAYKQAVLDAEKQIGSDTADKTFATLINNVNTFYDLAQKTGQGITEVTDTISDTMKSLQADSASLQVQLLRAQGNTAAANASQFAIDTAGMSPDEIAQYKANQALQQQINDLTSATQHAASVDQERTQLQDELNQLTLTNGQLLQLQRDSLDSSNQALFDQIQQVKAQQAAEAEAAAEAAAAAAHAQAVGDEHMRLETQLLQLQGDTTALRQQELDALQPENRALMEQIYALEDAKAAEDARTKKLQATTAVLKQQKDAWHQLADTIGQEAARIHSEMIGPASTSTALANVAILEARARAGDKSAAAQLAAASQHADTVASSTAHSATELALTRASLAYGLQQTGSVIDAAYGTASNAPVVDQLVSVNSTLRSMKKSIDTLVSHADAIKVHTHATNMNTKQAIDRGVPALADPGA